MVADRPPHLVSSVVATWETVQVARSRFRSVRYDLAAAVEVARLADSAGGVIGPDILAPALGYSGTNNGAYLSRVANARLFGVIGGRGSRLELTERGRRILAGVEPDSSRSRQEAFEAVPLFRAVAEAAASKDGLLPADLARWLVDDFGEAGSRARTSAEQLVASAEQAGLVVRTIDGKIQLRSSFSKFTSVDKPSSFVRTPQLGWLRGTRPPPREEVAMAENGLWLDDDIDGTAPRRSGWRRLGVVASAAAILIVVAVPVALVADGSSARPAAVHSTGRHPTVGNGPAEHEVLSALSATTDSGTFDFSYSITSTPASTVVPTTTPTTVCSQIKVLVPTGSVLPGDVSVAPAISQASTGVAQSVPAGLTAPGYASSASFATSRPSTATTGRPAIVHSGSGSGGGRLTGHAVTVTGGEVGVAVGPSDGTTTAAPPPGMRWQTERECQGGPTVEASPDVDGSGTINTSPYAMVASADIGNGLDVSVRLDGSVVYEGQSGDTGLAPVDSEAGDSGSPLPGFAGITESTLGAREGAVAKMGMASPTGYLDLIQPAIGAASQTGSGTVDGVPVTNYQVSNDLSQLAGAAGTSGPESQTITSALAVLQAQGYSSNTAIVSIDGSGFIRQVKSTDTFSDGGTVTLLASFSDFGCAGIVLMPGQTGSGVPPTGCTSPDGPDSSTTTTTSTTGVSHSPVTPLPSRSTETTIGDSPTTSTTPTTAPSTGSSTTVPSTSTTTSVPSTTST